MSGTSKKSKEVINQTQSPTLLLCSHIASVSRGASHTLKQEALLEEIAEDRAVVSLECPVKKGTAVNIDCHGCELKGKVADCTAWVGGYRAEIHLDESQHWSPDGFRPAGLFNPRSMSCPRRDCQPDCVSHDCVGATEPVPPTSCCAECKLAATPGGVQDLEDVAYAIAHRCPILDPAGLSYCFTSIFGVEARCTQFQHFWRIYEAECRAIRGADRKLCPRGSTLRFHCRAKTGRRTAVHQFLSPSAGQ